MALHLSIDPLVKFDRKILHLIFPRAIRSRSSFIRSDGMDMFWIETAMGRKRARIERIHMEEDKVAKRFHLLTNFTLAGFLTCAGTPLIEIVSKPDMHNGQEAEAYVEELRKPYTTRCLIVRWKRVHAV